MKAAQRGVAKTRIGREKIRGAGVQIGEIAAPASGNPDLLARVSGLLKQQRLTAALTGDSSAHQARGPSPENNDVMTVRVRIAIPCHSTSSTSTATASFCRRDPTMMPSTGDTSEKSRPTASTM